MTLEQIKTAVVKGFNMNRLDPNVAFQLRIKIFKDDPMIIINAYDHMKGKPQWDSAGRVCLYVEVRQGGKIIFPKGSLYCAQHGASDGIEARENTLSLVAIKPGDTDEEYFSDYTPEQLAWCEKYGEELSMMRELRYCDSNGNTLSKNVRKRFYVELDKDGGRFLTSSSLDPTDAIFIGPFRTKAAALLAVEHGGYNNVMRAERAKKGKAT